MVCYTCQAYQLVGCTDGQTQYQKILEFCFGIKIEVQVFVEKLNANFFKNEPDYLHTLL